MRKTNPKISYDADADVLSVAQPVRAKISHATELGNFVVHFTKDERPVLIEVLDASKTFGKNRAPLRQIAEIALTPA